MSEERKAVVYCDESGNTGPNYVDPDQPFYALAAWVVPHEHIADAAAEVELHRQEYSPQSRELKGAILLKTERGRRGVISLIRTLGHLGCVPLYEILEKRYCIAGKIVETFLDPLYNPRVNNAFIPDVITKQEIANTLYERVPDEVLNRFATAYRDPSPAAFEASLGEIVSAVRTAVNSELAELMDGSRPNLNEIARVEASVTIAENAAATLNLPVLAGMLMMIELLARQGVVAPAEFVHDEIHPYEEGFRKLYGRLRKASDGVFEYPNGAVALFPLRHVPKFAFCSSTDSPLIQAADALAGSICHLAKRAIRGTTVTKLEVELASYIFPALLSDVPRIAWSVGSDRWLAALGKYYIAPLFGGHAPTKSKNLPERSDELGPAPLLPPVRRAEEEARSLPRYVFPFPVYGLVGRQSGHLMSVKGLDSSLIPGGAAVLLFSCENRARQFIEEWQRQARLTEQQDIRAFGPNKVSTLVQLLESAQEFSQTVVMNWGCESRALLHLSGLVSGLRRSLNRVRRAMASGIWKQMYQDHDVGGMRIVSWLASDGSYIASRYPDGDACHGKSRDEAVGAVVQAEQNRQS